MPKVTAHMIQSFQNNRKNLQETGPCHIVLKDGRSASEYLSVVDIFSILKALNTIGVDHPAWPRFAHFKDTELQKEGWTIPSAETILTKIFSKNL